MTRPIVSMLFGFILLHSYGQQSMTKIASYGYKTQCVAVGQMLTGSANGSYICVPDSYEFNVYTKGYGYIAN